MRCAEGRERDADAPTDDQRLIGVRAMSPYGAPHGGAATPRSGLPPRPALIATPGGALYNRPMTRPHRLRLACTLPALAALTACARQSAEAVSTAPGTPGFLYGLWHGFIFPVAWLLSLVSDRVAVYAVPNNGGWYDFGYFLGIVVFGVGARSGTRTVYRTVYVDRRRMP